MENKTICPVSGQEETKEFPSVCSEMDETWYDFTNEIRDIFDCVLNKKNDENWTAILK